MVSLTSLALPIVLAAVAVFFASSIIHMVLGYHRSDYGRVPDEDAMMSALRGFKLPPGDYFIPMAAGQAQMKDPEFQRRMTEGPRAIVRILPGGMPAMGALLGKWFVFCLVVSLFAGYLASRTLAAGTPYLTVFRLTSTVAFAGYALATWGDVIWFDRPVRAVLKSTFDALVFALLTGGVFGWRWPM